MEKTAMRVGEKWLPYRQAEHSFSVHSIFNRVINLSTGQGLLSVTADGIGGSSAFMTVSGNFADYGAAAGRHCVVREGQMFFANCTINFKNSAVWSGPIKKEYRYKTIKKDNVAAFKAVLDRKAAPQSAWRCIHGDTESRFGVIRRLRENPSLAGNLIGLGQGLTPAGDDMLTGFLAMVNHNSENRSFVRRLHREVSALLGKTVDLSAQLLSNALDCDYHEYVQNCVRDICEGEKEEVYISAASLLGIGATSGSDIACGMYFGMSDL